MLFEIEIHPDARDDLASLPKKIQRQVDKKLLSLAQNPRPTQARRLQGNKDLWRIRSGDYRIIYEIRDHIMVVLVVRIGDRKDVYRKL